MSDEHKKDVDAYSGVDTTGHEWDGIKELDNPLPRWWVWVFYASIVWSVIYWIFMPSWPALPGMDGHLRGVRDHSERANVAVAIAELEESRAPMFTRLTEAADTGGIRAIEADPDLLNFALAAGSSAFGDNCATCHGAGGRGAVGYPALADDVWLWDGTLDGIEYTLRHGIRHDADLDTRFSAMPSFGRDGILSTEEIGDLTQYVLHVSGQEADMAAVGRATPVFEAQCSTCHGINAQGDRSQGAPNLTDAEWLYGGSQSVIYDTIYNARNSHMPAWQGRLDDASIKAVAVYVHTLGGGE